MATARIFLLSTTYQEIGSAHTRIIMPSVALIRAAAVCPGLSRISRAEVAVMIDVICCSTSRNLYFGHQSAAAHTIDPPHELIPSADTAHYLFAFGSGPDC